MSPREALELIAAPMRPDGTWNRDREACRQLAAEVLDNPELHPQAGAQALIARTTSETIDGVTAPAGVYLDAGALAAAQANGGKTGHPPGMLQDDSRKLTDWFAGKPDARLRVREAAQSIVDAKPTRVCWL